jgi:putative ubiquitin-RnfH superfamily antitoxin RatB of RatAB toxin-antitoxin module
MARSEQPFAIEVVYALPGEQVLLSLEVTPGTTVREAIELSGIRNRCTAIDLAKDKVGIFGRQVSPGTVLRNGDRVEIYRPLIVNPKDARRQRVRKNRQPRV